MKLRHVFAVLLSVLFLSNSAFSQNSKPELNDQLWEAVRGGDVAAVTALLDKGADVNARFRYGATALFKAAERGYVDVVKVLLARGADVHVRDTFNNESAMDWAVKKGHTEVARALLEKGAGNTEQVLMSGTRRGNTEMVRLAISKGDLKPQMLTAALAISMNDEKKTAISEILRQAGAVPPPVIDFSELQTYAGRYRNERGLEDIITVKDGRLVDTPLGEKPITFVAVDRLTFIPVLFDSISITFDVENGKVTGLKYRYGQNTSQFKRTEDERQ